MTIANECAPRILSSHKWGIVTTLGVTAVRDRRDIQRRILSPNLQHTEEFNRYAFAAVKPGCHNSGLAAGCIWLP